MTREYLLKGYGAVLTKLRRFRQGGAQTWNGSAWIDTNTISDSNFGTLGVINLTQVVTADATAMDLFYNAGSLGSVVAAGEFGLAYTTTPTPTNEATNGPATPIQALVVRNTLGSTDQDEAERITDIHKRRTHANTEASSYGDTLNIASAYGHERIPLKSGPKAAGVIPVYQSGGTLLGNITSTNAPADAITATSGN